MSDALQLLDKSQAIQKYPLRDKSMNQIANETGFQKAIDCTSFYFHLSL